VADISQVTALLATMVTAAVYPNGATAPSVTGNPITIFEGWPLQQSLDAAITAGQSQVSVFPTRMNTSHVFQVLNEDYLIVPPVHGLTITGVSEDGTVTVTGTPTTGEFLTIIANGIALSQTGPDLPTILNAIATQAAPNFPGVTVGSGSIQFPTSFSLKARIGAPATKGRVTHRQRAGIMVTVWSPNNADRNTISIAVDVALKQVNRLTFPDTSEGVLVADRFEQIDAIEPASVFRRDLCFTCEYATLFEYQAVEITSFTLNLDSLVQGGSAEQTFVTG
jgi:hypothetical protein